MSVTPIFSQEEKNILYNKEKEALFDGNKTLEFAVNSFKGGKASLAYKKPVVKEMISIIRTINKLKGKYNIKTDTSAPKLTNKLSRSMKTEFAHTQTKKYGKSIYQEVTDDISIDKDPLLQYKDSDKIDSLKHKLVEKRILKEAEEQELLKRKLIEQKILEEAEKQELLKRKLLREAEEQELLKRKLEDEKLLLLKPVISTLPELHFYPFHATPGGPIHVEEERKEAEIEGNSIKGTWEDLCYEEEGEEGKERIVNKKKEIRYDKLVEAMKNAGTVVAGTAVAGTAVPCNPAVVIKKNNAVAGTVVPCNPTQLIKNNNAVPAVPVAETESIYSLDTIVQCIFSDRIQYEKYYAIFKAQEFDYESFLMVDNAVLAELGIISIGARLKIIKYVEYLKYLNLLV